MSDHSSDAESHILALNDAASLHDLREVGSFAAALDAAIAALRAKEPPHCPTCSCAPGSLGAKDIGIEFLFKWMYARNPMLGNMKPIDMMLLGRGDKVAKFIMEAMLDSMPPGSADD